MLCTIFKHKWQTVAIDSGHQWYFVKDKDKENRGDTHIVLFQVCRWCGKHHMAYDDPTKAGREYAENGHSDVALARTLWLQAGELKPSGKNIQYLDNFYSPDKGVKHLIDSFKNDEDFGKLIEDNPTVKSAVDDLEIALKLCQNIA